jgi:hypothetical protein
MKLVAIWVEDYMRIKNQGFNLGSACTYDFQFDLKTRDLIVSGIETPNFFELFPQAGICNITGVIGTNGSGKTSLLKLLNVIEAGRSLSHPVVLIFEDRHNKKIKIVSYEKIRQENRVNLHIGTIVHKNFKQDAITKSESSNPFGSVNILYYSNLYSDQNDKYLYKSNKPSKLNRSVDYQTSLSLSQQNVSKYLEQQKQKEQDRKLLSEEGFNVMKLYEDDKLKRLIKFLSDVNTKHRRIKDIFKKINFPQYITVWSNDNIIPKVQALSSRSLYSFEKIKTEIYPYCIKLNKSENSYKIKFRNDVILKIFLFSFYTDIIRKGKEKIPLRELESFVEKLKLESDIFQNILEFMRSHTYSNFSSHIGAKIDELFKEFDGLITSIEIIPGESWMEEGTYKLIVSDKLWSFLSILLSVQDYESDPLYLYSWHKLSAGENAILNQFSEYYDAIPFLDKKNVVVSIDEGELYLHPEWQRQYVNSLYQFFNFFNEELRKNFQFIITSHSPFIVSDIPTYNLIFLEKDEKGYCSVSKSMNHKPTLGGNIFELFSDGFFVTEFISEFAFNKINDAFKFLYAEPSTFLSLNEVESFTKLVGEPIISEELQKLIDRRKNENFDTYYELYKEEEKEIVDTNEIKEKKKKRK